MVVTFAVLSFIVAAITWARHRPSDRTPTAEAKKNGREAVASQVTALLTASSILLAGSMVGIQLGSSEKSFSDGAMDQILAAAVAFAVSVAFAVWNSALILPLSRTRDVAENPITNILLSASLYTLLAGAGFFAVGLFLV